MNQSIGIKHDLSNIDIELGSLVIFYEPYELIYEINVLLHNDRVNCKLLSLDGHIWTCDSCYVFEL